MAALAGAPTASQPATQASAEEDLLAARKQVRETGLRLAKHKIPMAAEPSFVFKP